MAAARIDIPAEVTVRGTGYRVTVHEDAVIFTQQEPVWGCQAKAMFHRAAGCWYVQVVGEADYFMVSHLVEMNALLAEWFGGNHEFKNGEHKP